MQATDAGLPAPLEELDLLTAAAREAGDIAMRYFRADPDVWMKAGQSPVSEADIAVDTFLKERLLNARRGYGWLSEETADSEQRLVAPRTFVVDPIDGTRAFIDGRDTWCVSIAIVENGISVAGVLDCPALEEVYSAALGHGSSRDGARLKLSSPSRKLRIGGPPAMYQALPSEIRSNASRAGHIPSLAYRIAMVADGRLDATFVKPNAHDWDIAAASLVLSEAGGLLLDRRGRAPRLASRRIKLGHLAAGKAQLRDLLVTALKAST